MCDHVFGTVFGVDFSGARQAGRTLWLARLDRVEGATPYRLTRLASLHTLCGTAEREPVLRHLVKVIQKSEGAMWALGFPFGLPVEVMGWGDWGGQFSFLRTWGEDAYGAGVACLNRAKELGHKGHIRRLTDIEMKAPWDTYSYRIIYQTFYGIRDVLGPLREETLSGPVTVQESRAAYGSPTMSAAAGTAVLPFDYPKLPHAGRVVVEACPASTLKRMGLPHQNYKQAGAGPLTPERRAVRRVILAGLDSHVAIGRVRRRTLMHDSGGDALDAVIAAIGAITSWGEVDHAQIAAHPRYLCEGRHYA